MPLRKSPTRTPAFLAANRRNALKSTGPRTARGKAQSRLNRLSTGLSAPWLEDFYSLLLDAPLGCVDRIARSLLTPEMARHPVIARIVDQFREQDRKDVVHKLVTRHGYSPEAAEAAWWAYTGAEPKPECGTRDSGHGSTGFGVLTQARSQSPGRDSGKEAARKEFFDRSRKIIENTRDDSIAPGMLYKNKAVGQ